MTHTTLQSSYEQQPSQPTRHTGLRTFLLKFAVFALFILGPLLVLNALYCSTNFYQGLNDAYRMNKYPDDITLTVFGDSHEVHGIDFRGFEDTHDGVAHNFSLASQIPFYDLNLLKERADSLAPGAVVLIPVSLFTFEENGTLFFRNVGASYNSRYFRVMEDKGHILDYSLEDDLLYHYLPVLTAKENLLYLFHDVEPPAHHYQIPALVVEDIDAAAAYRADSWINQVMVPEDDLALREQTADENLAYLQAMIDFCEQHGFRPVLLVSPNTNQMAEAFGEARVARFEAYLARLSEANPAVPLLDYLQDQRFSANLSYFEDADHLNAPGAQAFTATLLADLKTRGLL